MLKAIFTDVVISKGYGEQPSLRYSEDGSSVRFRIGKRVYDKRAQDNHRWININVKAFGDICDRVQKMKLDEGSYIHLEGRYDEDNWEENGKQMRAPVIILSDIEYAYTGNGTKNGNGKETAASNPSPAEQDASQAQSQNGSQTEMPGNFTGFESFGGPNPFFPPSQG